MPKHRWYTVCETQDFVIRYVRMLHRFPNVFPFFEVSFRRCGRTFFFNLNTFDRQHLGSLMVCRKSAGMGALLSLYRYVSKRPDNDGWMRNEIKKMEDQMHGNMFLFRVHIWIKPLHAFTFPYPDREIKAKKTENHMYTVDSLIEIYMVLKIYIRYNLVVELTKQGQNNT